MKTNSESVRVLIKNMISRLENDKSIVFNPRQRHEIVEEIVDLVQPFILTDQDLKLKALEMIGKKSELLAEKQEFTEDQQYKTSFAMVKEKFGAQALSGFYFQDSPRSFIEKIIEYFLSSSKIEDVFETDADLQKKMIQFIKTFV
jgi:hypothetical protein